MTYIKTLSQAKKRAELLGYTTQERDGRLYYYKGGVETGSTLIAGFTPEPTVSSHAVERILEDEKTSARKTKGENNDLA